MVSKANLRSYGDIQNLLKELNEATEIKLYKSVILTRSSQYNFPTLSIGAVYFHFKGCRLVFLIFIHIL